MLSPAAAHDFPQSRLNPADIMDEMKAIRLSLAEVPRSRYRLADGVRMKYTEVSAFGGANLPAGSAKLIPTKLEVARDGTIIAQKE